MTLQQLLDRVAAHGVVLAVEGEELHVRAGKGIVDADLRADLRKHKPALLALLRRRVDADAGEAAIPRVARGRDLPLSFSQRRLWFLDQLEGGRAIYHLPASAWLDGPLDVSALRLAFAALIERHEALRTTFHVVDGEPVQRIGDAPLDLAVDDLSGMADADAEARRRATALVREPFDLARGPLFRIRLFKTASRRHLLTLSLHHIVADAWSMGVLMRELARLYDAARSGTDAALPPLEVQYADVAAWQHRRLTGSRLEQLLSHARSRLADAPQLLELPSDRVRPAAQSFRGGMERFTIDAAAVSEARDLASRHGATMFQALVAVFQTLLYRQTRQSSVMVGSPIANRLRAETEPVVGFFVNTLVLRADFSGDSTFASVLERVKADTLDAYEHQELPFEALVAELSPVRSLSQNPIFQAMFALQNAPAGPLQMGGVDVARCRLDLGISKFDLYLSLEEEPDGSIAGEWEYASDLFDPATIERMIAQFRILLAAAVREPDQRVRRLPLMTAAEEAQIVVDWNRTALEWPARATIVELFDQQVARTPDALALVDQDERVSYRELDRRANRLANHLRSLDAGPATLVGVCLPRTSDMVTAILAVLKTGAAYVALDPAYPRERIAFMVADAAMPIVVTHSAVAAHIPEDGAALVTLDADRAAIAAAPASPPGVVIPSDALAYVIYTSGSTGRPKGIQIEHRNAVSMLAWAATVFSPEDLRGTLASTSLCFDLSVFEIFLPLTRGGAVIVAENALALPAHPAAGDVTLVNTVPSAMAELLRGGGLPRSVRVVNLAGEPLKAALVDRLYAVPHVRDVYDLYGPGETTTYSTCGRRERGGRESIGRPIANTRLYILDEDLRPVAIGVPGEIYIGGPGVTRGYLGREELTRERYLRNPFGSGRLYRTGDLGRFWPDGEVQYLGRIDHQVKIRGFRIEPGEIETVLAEHEAVRECVVTTRGGEEDHKRLVAYFSGDATAADLRRYLQGRLAPFMVPSVFVRLDAMPRTPNGKIDRQALPEPEAAEGDRVERHVEPATPAEAILCGIWRDVLRRTRVGTRDNFFEIGGDSILAIQVVSRARDAGLAITPPQMFTHQTVGELAAIALSIDQAVVEDQLDAADRDVPLTAIQQWGLAHDPPDPHHFNQWVQLELPAGLPAAVLTDALHDVANRHGALRLRFTREAGGWRQRYEASAAAIAIETLDAGADGFDLQREASRLHASLDLTRGPIARAAIVTRDGRPSQLVLTIHHLAVDGVSWRILCDDLVARCAQLSSGAAGSLPARTAPYWQWAEALASSNAPAMTGNERSFGTYAESDRVTGVLDAGATRDLLEACTGVVPRPSRPGDPRGTRLGAQRHDRRCAPDRRRRAARTRMPRRDWTSRARWDGSPRCARSRCRSILRLAKGTR